ncbi:TspO/MBR family protein [Solimonas marina]|uniref:Tryptophan-rich sensory protein n=1 Tax=Solimonas marina TaxID=2714601 RepID=A0A969W6L0_9GAMM|nr:TspO/MBR family protein [Solimonas marina]NKF20849.1 tryptophan-rich sensory protein [Solimonas marina]
MRKGFRSLVSLLCCLLIVFVGAAIGALGSINAGSFYAELARPPWAPPGSVFGPVWTLLYVMMGVALWRAWRRRVGRDTGPALVLYALQLLANVLWTWFFFRWRQGGLAFAEVLLLWALVAATIFSFWRVQRLAAVLLLPYFAWVSFAVALTYAVWQRNPALLG